MERWVRLAAKSLILNAILACTVLAQPAPSSSDDSFFRTRFLYSGEVVGNIAPKDPGYFNDTDYRRDALRLFRLNFAFELRATDKLSVLAEIRSDNLDVPKPYALYARFQPWRSRAFDLQVGLIPPVFGKYSRRRYEYDNPLIGYPVPYQYPTVLRADAAPSSLEQLLRYRGYGAVTRYPIGDPAVEAGLAQVNPLRWDTGIEVKLGDDPVEVAVALTQGTLSDPQVRDNNDGKQIAARLGLRPSFGTELGVSAAFGDYLANDVKTELETAGAAVASAYHQTSVGVDGEAARGAWILRGEAIWTSWEAPPTLGTGALSALGFMIELRYKIFAGFHTAVRVSGLRFGTVDTSEGSVTWDAPVNRVEGGIGYNLSRRILGKFSLQYNDRDGGRTTSRWTPAAQLLFWF